MEEILAPAHTFYLHVLQKREGCMQHSSKAPIHIKEIGSLGKKGQKESVNVYKDAHAGATCAACPMRLACLHKR
eukprot:scaffold157902_cov17-Tisochrysis_lutea.AAC.1